MESPCGLEDYSDIKIPIGKQPNINTVSPAAAARVALEEQNRKLEARMREHVMPVRGE